MKRSVMRWSSRSSSSRCGKCGSGWIVLVCGGCVEVAGRGGAGLQRELFPGKLFDAQQCWSTGLLSALLIRVIV
eukprot:352378-Chlamydomonas_euryale.AAC.2